MIGMVPPGYVKKVRDHQAREAWGKWMRKFLRTCIEQHPALLSPRARVLDYGCGPGRFTQLLWEMGVKNPEGMDANPDMIAQAQNDFPERDFCAGASVSPMLRYTHVFMTNVLGHIPNPQAAISNMARSMPTSGVIFVFNPNKVHTILRLPVDALKGYKPDPTLRHHWTKTEMAQMFEREFFEMCWHYNDGYSYFGVKSNYGMAFRKT